MNGLASNPDRKIAVAWMISLALITARELRTKEIPLGLPRPSAYVGSAIVYGAAAIIAEFAPELAVAAAAGWTIAIAYQSFGSTPASSSSSSSSSSSAGPRIVTSSAGGR